jgi:hypothetical protein
LAARAAPQLSYQSIHWDLEFRTCDDPWAPSQSAWNVGEGDGTASNPCRAVVGCSFDDAPMRLRCQSLMTHRD